MNTKASVALGCALVGATLASAAAADAKPRVAWVYGWGTDLAGGTFGNTEHIRAIDTDAAGNVYAIGPSGGAQAVKVYGRDGVVATLPNLGGSDIVIAKVDRAGRLVWAKAFGGAADDGAYDISIDRAGALLITGRTTGTLALGASMLTRGGFVAKLTADGVPVWAVATEGVPNEQDSDASGNIYTATPDGVTKFDPNGKRLWHQPLSGGGRLSPASVRGVAMAGDGSGDVLVAGQFSGTVGLGGASAAGVGGLDAFVGRLRAADGAAVFLNAVGGPGADYGRGVSPIGDDFYFAGSFTGAAAFQGGPSLASAGGQDVFVARLDGAGKVVWATSVGGPGEEEGAEVSTGRGGVAVIGGSFAGTIQVGASTITSRGSSDFLVAAIDERKNPLWAAAPLGGAGRDLVYAAGADEQGGATFAGGYEGTAQFGDVTLTAAGGLDGVFGMVVDDTMAVDPSPPPTPPGTPTPGPGATPDAGGSAAPVPVPVPGGAPPAPTPSDGGGCAFGGPVPARDASVTLAGVVVCAALVRRRRR